MILEVVENAILKKWVLTIFADFMAITSDTIFLAICLCRKLFNTIFEMCEELGARNALRRS